MREKVISSNRESQILQRPAATIRGKVLNFQWPRSIALNLAVAVVVGFLYSLWVMGPAPLNPGNVERLPGDGATAEVTWELFRQDHELHWPITFTNRIGYPQGDSIYVMDPNPLMAVLLKPFSSLLPEPFQYLGIEVVLACTLQFFFALLLFRLLLGPNPFAVVLPALFFLVAPPLTWRMVGHYALTNQWLITAALFVFCLAQKKPPGVIRLFVIESIVLAAVAIAINPYIAVQVLFVLTTSVVVLTWQRRITLGGAAGAMAALGATCFFVALAFWAINIAGYTAGGYRKFSLNLLALIDPQNYGSILLPKMPSPFFGQYEGYSYLGFGAILLALSSIPVFIRNRHKYSFMQRSILVPVVFLCLVLTALALSTKVTFGSLILDLDPHQKLTPYLSIFRASGRLFWTPYYIILGTVLVAAALSFRRKTAICTISAAFVLQLADTSQLRAWVHSGVSKPHPSPLHSPVWSKLGSIYKNLIVMPPWQCGAVGSPGGGWLSHLRIFGV